MTRRAPGSLSLIGLLAGILVAPSGFAQPAAPDLEVSGINFNGTPQLGVPIQATAVLKNIGGVNSGNFTIQWKINGVQVGLGGHGNLAPGQTSIDNVRHTFTPNGSFTIEYIADPFNQLPELSNSNNSFSRSVTLIPQKPDLSAGSISVSGTPRVGEPVTFSVGVSNIGPVGTPNAVPIRWVAHGSVFKAETVAPFFAGEARGFSATWTPTSAGSVTIVFEADAGNANDESNESNNNRSLSINVLPPPLPDLTPGGINFSTGSPQQGEPFTMSASVLNIGSQVSPAVPVQWRVNGAVVHQTTIAPIGNGGSQPTSHTFTPNFSGNANVELRVDYNDSIQESNEGNNNVNANITIAAPPRPDIRALDITVSPAPQNGSPSTVTGFLTNSGSQPSPAIPVRFLVNGNPVHSSTAQPLDIGQSTSVSFTWTPSSAGNATLVFETDAGNTIQESNESNNNRSEDVNVAQEPRPDLFAQSVGIVPAPKVGSSSTVSAGVTNIGDIPTASAVPVRLTVNGSVVGNVTLPPIANGGAQNAVFSWIPTQAGPQTVAVAVDPANVILEKSESNNTSQTTAVVEGPDLVPTAISFSSPPTVTQTTTASANVVNTGGVDAPPVSVQWRVDGAIVASATLPAIPSGGAQPASFVWTPASPGPHTVQLFVDPANAISENNEGNNTATASPNVADIPTMTLSVSTNALTRNAHGWYGQNPVRVRATLHCPANYPECTGQFFFNASSSTGSARFYNYETTTTSGSETCSDTTTGSAYSFIEQDKICVNSIGTYRLSSGQDENIDVMLWVQPARSATLELAASWGVLGDTEALSIETADIQPIVFLHGILGSQPPQDKLITNQGDAVAILDPFLGGYTPLLVNLQKLGYEWNKSLFALAYDWRQSNRRSAGFLAEQLRVVLPRARAEDYVKDDAKADLVVHSMGGMVSRAYLQGVAIHPESGDAEDYQDDVRKLVFMASPHKGFPFDYRTYEGNTWQDYLYDAPLVSGGSMTLTLGMDGLIWPILAYKHFDPTDDELFDICTWLPNQPMPPAPVLYQVWVPGFRDGTIGVYACTQDSLNEMVKHEKRGVLSLLEMLPTEDTGAYLLNLDGDPPGRTPEFPWQHDENEFLTDLNEDIDVLKTHLGLEDIYAIYGNGADTTDLTYEVAPPPGANMWSHGQVVDSGLGQGVAGDDLVPAASASMLGLLDLDDAHRIELSAAPAGNDPAGSGRHKQIMFHPTVQRELIPGWLTGVEAPFASPHIPPLPSAGTITAVLSACPINLLVEDSVGRRAGYDPMTGRVVKEIPGAIVTLPGAEPHMVLVPNAEPGAIRVVASGYETGEFQVLVEKLGPDGAAPVALFTGTTTAGEVDEFTFDNEDDSSPSTPVAVDDAYGMERGGTLNVLPPGVLANDVELNGAALTAELVDDVSEGALTLELDGSFTYVPPAEFLGTVRFTYLAKAGDRPAVRAASVTIAVNLPNIPPVAAGESYTTELDVAIHEAAPGVLENDTDENLDPLTAKIVSATTHGVVSLHADGSFDYAPSPGYIGPDSFTYVANDGFYDSSVARVSLEVLPPNQPPAAGDDLYRTELTDVLEVAAPGVMTNDSDPDGDPLSVSLESSPSFGTLTLNPDGGFTYEPGDAFNGVDEFTYRLSDGRESVVATVNLRPPADCEELYGIDTASDTLMRIDPATGAVTNRVPLAIDVASAAMAFDSGGRLWAVSQLAADPDRVLLYRIDLASGAVKDEHEYRISDSRYPLDGSRIGLAMAPDGKTLYAVSGSTLLELDTRSGRSGKLRAIPADGTGLVIDSEALGLPGRCRDLIAYDTLSMALTRVSTRNGSVSPIGPTGLDVPVKTLAGAPNGALYGVAGSGLYRFDLDSGQAELEAELSTAVDAAAFRPAYAKTLCLDRDFDRKTGLSRYVVKEERVNHVKKCHDPHDECERHGKKNCSKCHAGHDHEDCGKCGDPGFYRFKKDGTLWVRTDALPADGVYRLRIQLRSPNGKSVRLRGKVGDARFSIRTSRRDWGWSESLRLRMKAGKNVIRLSADEKLDIERISIERDCPGLCEGEKQNRCLDTKVDKKTGLSKYVVELEGRAGYSKGGGGCCGGKGYYYVRGASKKEAPGRVVAELELAESGRYVVRFQYRVGDNKQNDESIRLSLGGKRFDFLDSELRNTREWEWSERVEVKLSGGRQRIEFLSIGRDSVHIERLEMEKVCECGGGAE